MQGRSWRPGVKNFSAKHLRWGVEIALASAELTQEIRGRLQSHRITGVQARHYDGHDYLPQQRRALETLYALLGDASKPASRRGTSAVPTA